MGGVEGIDIRQTRVDGRHGMRDFARSRKENAPWASATMYIKMIRGRQTGVCHQQWIGIPPFYEMSARKHDRYG